MEDLLRQIADGATDEEVLEQLRALVQKGQQRMVVVEALLRAITLLEAVVPIMADMAKVEEVQVTALQGALAKLRALVTTLV